MCQTIVDQFFSENDVGTVFESKQSEGKTGYAYHRAAENSIGVQHVLIEQNSKWNKLVGRNLANHSFYIEVVADDTLSNVRNQSG